MLEQGAIFVEIAKGVAQAGTAAIVAALSFFWAVNQYRKQRLWDRKVESYYAVLEALTEVRRLIIIEQRSFDPQTGRRGRYDAANFEQRLESSIERLVATSATARLILDTTSAGALSAVMNGIGEVGLKRLPRAEAHREMIALLEATIEELSSYGRAELKVD